MKIEAKLIALSAIAIVVGVASIFPLYLLMTSKAQPFPDDLPQFSIDVPYVYVGDYWNVNSVTANQSYGYVYSLVFRSSPNFDPNILDAEARIEYYTAVLSSEKGLIGNATFATEASKPNAPWMNYSLFCRNQWFTNNESQGSFMVFFHENGTGTGFANGQGEDWNRTLGKPETLVLTVRRLGWVILANNSAAVHIAGPDVILEIHLHGYREGFVYNNIFTEEELSKINPAMPQYKLTRDRSVD